MRAHVAIVGAGPAGLVLSHLLDAAGIESVVLEARSRAHVEGRIRAGVLEQGTADLLRALGVGARMDREGLVHGGIQIAFAGRGRRVDIAGLTGGRRVTVYGQHDVVKDLIAARLAAGGRILFEAPAEAIEGAEGDAPRVHFRHEGRAAMLECDFVAGCDGFHGMARAAIPPDRLTLFERALPFAWLGILAETPPPSRELVYAAHERGFALYSMRSPRISRLYIQCRPDEDLRAWPDARLWEELQLRLEGADAGPLAQGRVLERVHAPMRAAVAEPMRHGRLFLAGDAAHIVPATGAKGLNLAVADARVLARALAAHYREGNDEGIEAYSATCLRRVWKVQRFSLWMSAMLHRPQAEDGFARRLRLAELDQASDAASGARALAQNYAGLPMEE